MRGACRARLACTCLCDHAVPSWGLQWHGGSSCEHLRPAASWHHSHCAVACCYDAPAGCCYTGVQNATQLKFLGAGIRCYPVPAGWHCSWESCSAVGMAGVPTPSAGIEPSTASCPARSRGQGRTTQQARAPQLAAPLAQGLVRISCRVGTARPRQVAAQVAQGLVRALWQAKALQQGHLMA